MFTAGSGRMRLSEEDADVPAGDTVLIPPGTRHKLWNTGTEPLRLLVLLRAPYSHEDTFLVE